MTLETYNTSYVSKRLFQKRMAKAYKLVDAILPIITYNNEVKNRYISKAIK
jgi:hypothetical protein